MSYRHVLAGLTALLLALAPAAAPPAAHAQGFGAFSGRNHPELRWRVAETEHFEIVYPARLAGIEAEAAPIAEASYDALAANLGVTFDEKIRLYLSDEDEITNGFAVPVGNGYTQIWVHTNEFASVFTGRDKWLRRVIAHELAHLFHFRATRSNVGLLSRTFNNPTPSFWAEGLAQYETEAWDAQRGDRWLRVAVLDDALSYSDGRSAWNGRLRYAVGNSQVRYFATRYGDSTLTRLLNHRRDYLFGLVRVHDLEDALEAVAGTSYREFYDDWRRTVNVYYNTIAGQLATPDSLRARRLEVPGRYLYDVQTAPRDTSRLAVLSLLSPDRPLRRLYVVDRAAEETEVVAEGAIRGPVTWHPDGDRLAFARTTRGRHGSLLNDLFLVEADGSGERRLTRSRRAAAPSFAPDGDRLAFVGVEGGTANVFVLDLATGRETRLTRFEGDVQVTALAWQPAGSLIAFSHFDADGARRLGLVDAERGTIRFLTGPATDDRLPVWRPDGQQLAFTSLRDDVPNVFVYDLQVDAARRVTYLAAGATATDWLAPDSAFAAGRLLVTATESKARDRAYLLDAAHRPLATDPPRVPAGFAAWTTHRPPREVPDRLAPDASLVTSRYAYDTWANLTHVASFGLPYYLGPGAFGVLGFTTWLEPLGKHALGLGADLSLADPADNSAFFGAYLNNQFRPRLMLSAYRFPGSARSYGEDLLVEDYFGGDLQAEWPLDWRVRPYTETEVELRLRYVAIEPLNLDEFDAETLGALAAPEEGQQADLRIELTRRRQRPYALAYIHPLDGHGINLRLTAAGSVLGADYDFLRGDVAAYQVLPGLWGNHRALVYGRLQAQTGQPLPQDYIGFSRYDHLQVGVPGFLPLTLGENERVRGYRDYTVGNRVAFGSAEYRVPLVADLRTEVLGLAALGTTTMAAFADGGAVWTGSDLDGGTYRLGLGVEIKNALRLPGDVRLAHALGVGQPVGDVGSDRNLDVYYRIRAAVPF